MRQKKRKLTNHNNLLHSDKSTYFYKGTLGKLFLRVQLFCHKGLYPGWRGSKSRPERSEGFDFESATKAHWQNSGRIQKTVITLSAFTLLGLAYFFANPFTNSADSVSAASPDPNFSITLSLGDIVKTEETLDTGVVGYIENNFTISSTATESYSIYLQPAEGYTNNLVGRKYNDITIPGVGDNVSVANFTNNTWGYGLTDINSTAVANDSLTYSTIPDGKTPIKTVSNPDDGNDTYKLVFAARIGDDKPADHYESQALLSVAASPEIQALWTTITDMNQMTATVCASMTESTSTSGDTYVATLKDTNVSGGAQSYTVAKLKDGNCWMTKDMVYVKNMTTSGNLFTWEAAKDVCVQMGGDWILPTQLQWANLLTAGGVTISTGAALKQAPYNMKYGGEFSGDKTFGAGRTGEYWSLTPVSDNAAGSDAAEMSYALRIDDTSATASATVQQYLSVSVRCVVGG